MDAIFHITAIRRLDVSLEDIMSSDFSDVWQPLVTNKFLI